MAKNITLNLIPNAGEIDLSGYKIRNSGAILAGDIGVPGMGNGTTLTTTDFVVGQAELAVTQAGTYTDGKVQNAYIELDTKIGALDTKKVNYTDGINTMGIMQGDYNCGLWHLFNLPSAILPD